MFRVLVGDDEEETREAIRRCLCREGYEVDPAATASEAIEKITSTRGSYDLVITDMVMEQPTSGLKVLEAALSRDLLTEVIVLTDYGNTAGAMEGIRRGAADYLDKHIPGVDFYEVLGLKTRQALQRRRFAIQTRQRYDDLARQARGEVGVR